MNDTDRLNLFHWHVNELIRLHGNPLRDSFGLSRNMFGAPRKRVAGNPWLLSVSDEIGMRSFMLGFRHFRLEKSHIRLDKVLTSAASLSKEDGNYQMVLRAISESLQRDEHNLFPQVGKKERGGTKSDKLIFNARHFHLDSDKRSFLERLGYDLEQVLVESNITSALVVFIHAVFLDEVLQHRNQPDQIERDLELAKSIELFNSPSESVEIRI